MYGTRETQKIQWVPRDQRLALPESDYSYVLQEWAQALGVEQSFGKVHEFLQRMLKLNAPVDSLERLNRQMAQAMLDLRTTYVNGQWGDFQPWRIDRETRRLYPHPSLLNNPTK